MDNLLVICVDRDNDLGRKTGIKGPVVGREANFEAAGALALADPSEADANCMFAAVKKFDELAKTMKSVEIATLTGYGKGGFASDRAINQQLDLVLEKVKPSGFVLVTNGAEDDQIIPILQGRGRIVSKETVIVKQAQEIESAFFTIKETIKDPYVARILFGIPGILLLLFFLFGDTSFQIVAFLLGIYLLLKGFGIEEPILNLSRSITGSINPQSPSFPLYIGSIFILAFGAMTAYSKYGTMQITDLLLDAVTIAQSTYLFIALAALSTVVGKCIDAVHFRRAFQLRRYVLTGVSALLFWWIVDAATLVLLRLADLNLFLMTVLGSFVVLLVAFKLSNVLDVKGRVTKLLVDLPVYSNEGTWIGKVAVINKKKESISYTDNKTKKPVEVSREKFSVANGKITLSG
ncbi:MAG: DUF373 family protein [Candidatus Diapherotrites archaeon]|nr:DUF373 family protein [Candidatus Diapherotrites archaeon]